MGRRSEQDHDDGCYFFMAASSRLQKSAYAVVENCCAGVVENYVSEGFDSSSRRRVPLGDIY
jgi:hypothetical protein